MNPTGSVPLVQPAKLKGPPGPKDDKLGKLKEQVKESLNTDFNFVGNE